MNIQTIHTKNLRWIDLVNPGAEEIQWLRNNFRFHELHFQAVSEHQQRPHIDQGDGYDFLVLLFPVYHKETQEIVAGEVDFFVGENFVLTAHYGDIHSLGALFDRTRGDVRSRDELMTHGPGQLLYRILETLFRRSYPILDHMNEDVSKIETRIFHQRDLDMLSKIALMKKNIIEFRRMMKTHHYVLDKLPKRRASYLNFPQSRLYYKDLLEYSGNIWDILETLKETVDTLHETSQSLASHRLSEISKVISIFSAIVLPATLVAFLFGVAVEGIPFRHHPFGFWIVAGIMAFSSALLLLIFKLKKWF